MSEKREEYQELFQESESWYTDWSDHGHYGGKLIPYSGGFEMEVEFAVYGLKLETEKIQGEKFSTFKMPLCREEARDIAAMLNAMVDELERRDQQKAERERLAAWNAAAQGGAE
jgi:hypothetical protein